MEFLINHTLRNVVQIPVGTVLNKPTWKISAEAKRDNAGWDVDHNIQVIIHNSTVANDELLTLFRELIVVKGYSISDEVIKSISMDIYNEQNENLKALYDGSSQLTYGTQESQVSQGFEGWSQGAEFDI